MFRADRSMATGELESELPSRRSINKFSVTRLLFPCLLELFGLAAYGSTGLSRIGTVLIAE